MATLDRPLTDKPSTLAQSAHKFTNPNDPLIVEIEQNEEGNWTIRPSKTAMVGAQSHSDILDLREQSSHAQILADWTAKKLTAAPSQPDFMNPPVHVPIIVEPGEKVRFRVQGGYPFTIFVNRHPQVQNNAASPGNPLGFTGGHSATAQSAVFNVASLIRGQRFYKCRADVNVNGTMVAVDPDLIGE